MTVSTVSTRPASAEPTPQRFANPLRRYFAATRPAFLSVTLVAALIGLASAYAELGHIDVPRAVVTVIFALVAHAAANVMNDYYDSKNGADDANSRRLFPFTGGSRFIQNRVLTPRQTAFFGYVLMVSVVLAGLWLTWQVGSGLLTIGVLGLLLGWAYSAPPFQLVSRGIGEVAIAGSWLLVVIGADYVQRTQFAWTPFLAGLPYALLVANLLYINQFPDHDGDAAAGKRTVIVRLGPERAKWGYLAIALFAYGWLILQIGRYNLPPGCGAAALALPLSLNAARQLGEHASQPEYLTPAIRLTILATLVYGVILAVTLAFNWRG